MSKEISGDDLCPYCGLASCGLVPGTFPIQGCLAAQEEEEEEEICSNLPECHHCLYNRHSDAELLKAKRETKRRDADLKHQANQERDRASRNR
jgi:hypothetical protein